MFAAATKKHAGQPRARPNCNEHRRLNCFNDFVGAAGRISPAGADDNEIVFFGGVFSENLRRRLPFLDRVWELDAGCWQVLGFLIESLSEWLFVARILCDPQKRDLGFSRAG